MTRPRVAVDMDHLLGAVATRAGDTRFLLDIGSGEVVLELAGAEDAESDEALRALPRWPLERELAALRGFAAAQSQSDSRGWLESLLAGVAGEVVLERLDEGLSRWPALRVSWQRARRDALLAFTLDWFDAAGIDVVYDLPPEPPAGLEPSPQAPREEELDLIDFLLVGDARRPSVDADAESSLVERRVRLASPDQAHRLFKRIVAEWCLLSGEDPGRHHDATPAGWQRGRLRVWVENDEVAATLALSRPARRHLGRKRRDDR